MGGSQQQQQRPSGPSVAQTSGGLANVAGLVAPFLGSGTANAVASMLNGFGGATKDGPAAAAGEANPFGFLGGVASGLSAASSIGAAADDMLPTVFGGMGNALGMVTGTMDALDDKKSGADRVVGGLDATANGLGLWGTLGGFSLGTSGSLSAGAALTAGGAASAGAAGAVLGSGVAGYKVGQTLNEVAASDHARNGWNGTFGTDSSGRGRTATDALIDNMVSLNLGADALGASAQRSMASGGQSANAWLDQHTGTDWLGDAAEGVMNAGGSVANAVMDYGGGYVGGMGTIAGSIGSTALDVGSAAKSWVGSWFN
jgi:hypothetical protein